jgi:hypothetical protein
MAHTGTHDPVTAPEHYTSGGIETLDFISAKLGEAGIVDYCVGNAIKYLSRTGKKANAAEDCAKAAFYCQMAAHVLDAPKYHDPRRARDGTG